jgi:DNA invertase Pin-like site-specific DNA recombinase
MAQRRNQAHLKTPARTPVFEPPRIGTYHRTSTADQDPTAARTELAAWAERHGGEIVLAIEETASGAWGSRPGLKRILAAARRGEIDTVIVWKLDRWGRSSLDLLANIRALSSAGCRFVAITQGLDVRPEGDAMSSLLLGVLAAVSEFERTLISERTKLGLAKARRRGRRLGRPRKARPTPEEIAELRDAGLSWRKLAKELSCSVGLAQRRYAELAEE